MGGERHAGESVLCWGQGEDCKGSALFSASLQYGEERLGLLRLRFPGSHFDRTVATTAADIIAMALYNCRLRAVLQDQALRDPLTGLYNRRFLDDYLHRELRRAERDNAPVSLLLLDLDHFKAVNDRFGHPTGDPVLMALARLLGQHIRGEDIVCRIGGEEFVAVLPGTATATAVARAETLRAAVSQLVVSESLHGLDNLSVSIGVAAFPRHASGAGGLIDRADRALYRAKESGRNRVVVASILGIV